MANKSVRRCVRRQFAGKLAWAGVKGLATVAVMVSVAVAIAYFMEWLEKNGLESTVCGGAIIIIIVAAIAVGCMDDTIKWVKKKWLEAERECSE